MAAVVKEPLVFRKEWVEQVQDILNTRKSLENADKIPRVAVPLLDAKPEAYIPHFVSLGPYHRWTLEKKIAASSSAGESYEFRQLKMSTVEAYKVQSATTFLRNRGESSDGVVKKMKEMQQKIEDFYDWKISRGGEYPEHFALMMAVDSCFLLEFLFCQSEQSGDDMKRLEVSIKCDILKLENQIPLFLLRSVFDVANEALKFNKLLQKTYKKLSPFDQIDIANNDTKTQKSDQQHLINIGETQIDDQPHLLGYLHAIVTQLVGSMKVIEVGRGPKRTRFQRVKHELEKVVGAVFGFLKFKHPYKEGRRHDILNSYNAGELVKAGILFSPFSSLIEKDSLDKNLSGQIHFDKYSGTLYLPHITVTEVQTGVFLRNMLALELNDANRGDHVTRYVGLMDCLIDTAEDVRLLRESQVIDRGSLMLTDKSIANIWDGICHPIFTGRLDPPENLNNALEEVLIRKYYMSIFNKLLWEFYWEHLSKPGKGVALFVGFLLLLLSIAQTFFAWKESASGK